MEFLFYFFVYNGIIFSSLASFSLFHLDAVRKIVSETYMLLKSKLPSTLQSLALYLANKDTEYILFKPVTVSLQRWTLGGY